MCTSFWRVREARTAFSFSTGFRTVKKSTARKQKMQPLGIISGEYRKRNTDPVLLYFSSVVTFYR